MVQIQQIVESVLPDVPIERAALLDAPKRTTLQVVDRDAFALELARQWVAVWIATGADPLTGTHQRCRRPGL